MTPTDIERATHSALAVTTGQTFWTPEQISALRQIGVENAPNGDLAVFLNYAQRTGLDPFSRQLYMIGRNQKDKAGNWITKWTIQASIDGLRIVAERSGDYAGQVGPEYCGEDGQWRDTWTAKTPPAAARVGVLRRGFTAPLYAVAYYDEYVQTSRDGNPTQMWKEKPRLMLAKCAEALAFRKAFPHDLSGIYTADEMGMADAPQVPQRVAPVAEVTELPAHDAETGEIVDGEVVEDKPEGYARKAPGKFASEKSLNYLESLVKKAGFASTSEFIKSGDAARLVGHIVSDRPDASDCSALIDLLKNSVPVTQLATSADPDDPWNTGERIMAAPDQLARLDGAFHSKGIGTGAHDKALRLSLASDVVGRDLTSARDLTRSECSAVITSIEAMTTDPTQGELA